MDASTARTRNIRRWVADAGGPAAFASQYGGSRWAAAQVSQWVSAAHPKGIGHRLARAIEAALGKPAGSMDCAPRHESAQRSQPARLDPVRLAITTRALGTVLGRRGANLDLSDPRDAELFAQVYAELEALPPDDDLTLGAAVAEFVHAQGKRKNAGSSGSPRGADRGKTGKNRGDQPESA